MSTIEIIVSPAGEARLETRGFGGRECLAASRRLEDSLGRMTSDRLTAEFFQPARESPSRLNEEA
jgi:hypothetical protein